MRSGEPDSWFTAAVGRRRGRPRPDRAALGLSAAALAAAPLAKSQAKDAMSCFPSRSTRSQAIRGGPAAAPARRCRCRSAARRRTAASAAARAAGPTSQDIAADVCILGAGIIGLCSALALLRADPALKVALVDRKVQSLPDVPIVCSNCPWRAWSRSAPCNCCCSTCSCNAWGGCGAGSARTGCCCVGGRNGSCCNCC